jgi:CheY-like chemotaxis protein
MQKLLLADDSVTIQRVIELTFAGEDVQVVAVNDGEQAIARIPIERPDIVLADIGMPKKGGYDVAAFVKGRADLEHIPVLLLAGAFEPVDQARAEQVRCDGVLIKPFEPRQVIERVRELLQAAKEDAARGQAIQSDPHPVAVTAGGEDLLLDDYFESLNAAFASVGRAQASGAASPAADTLASVAAAVDDIHDDATEEHDGLDPAGPTSAERAPRRRGDALDEYFDRLSNAFEQVKPAGASHEAPNGLDEVDRDHVPTVEALMGRAHEAGNGAGNGNGTGHGHPRSPSWRTDAAEALDRRDGPPRNPIVDALEALLAAPVAPAPAPPVPASMPTQPTLPGLPDIFAADLLDVPERPDLADEVAQRVLERLVPEITAAVQRVVHEEVERIKRHH